MPRVWNFIPPSSDWEETSLHINGLELSVVLLMLGSLGEALLSQVTRIKFDSTTTVAFINEGGVRSPALNRESMLLYE